MIITILRKPLEGSVAENTLKHGCGAINIDATRIPTSDPSYFKHWDRFQSGSQGIASVGLGQADLSEYVPTGGRFPANFIISDEVEALEVLPKETFFTFKK
jgi:hypothetical protein